MIKQASHAKYDISWDNGKKVILMEVRGFFRPEDGESFLKDYNSMVSKVKPSEYTLVVDPENLKTSAKDMLPVLKGCFELYGSSGFKKILMITPTSATSAMQLKNVQKDTGVKMEFAKTNPYK
ncbi:hypothetical protein [Anaeromicrobium sediminis]|uniref:DUF4325 domain-containing protein n=1 Tax=Anaeromicrobium sediminis TaxID=1478221 RepID=A0A267MM47_9FIRM|nr:hypothetical protein [Anaeromicrobium sediminis]PAB60681.1 hypothetical protein CCE28_03845 [Anaeromicrobium sediminis]